MNCRQARAFVEFLSALLLVKQAGNFGTQLARLDEPVHQLAKLHWHRPKLLFDPSARQHDLALAALFVAAFGLTR